MVIVCPTFVLAIISTSTLFEHASTAKSISRSGHPSWKVTVAFPEITPVGSQIFIDVEDDDLV